MATEQVETAIYRLRIEGQDQIDRLTKSIEGLAVAEEDATKTTRTTSDELQKRIARYDPLIRAQRAYSEELERIARFQEAGVGTQQEINALFEGATSRYQAQSNAIKGLSDAHKGLDAAGQSAFHSMRSMAEQLAIGVPITQVVTQQFSHLAFAASSEGGIAGAFKQVAGMLTNMITPMRVVGGGAVALGAGALYAASSWSDAQKTIQRALIGIGAQTGTSVAQINQFAQQNASATGLSVSQARDVGVAFARTGNIVISQIEGVGQAVHGYSILTGKTATEATKDLASALGGDLVKGAEELNKTYGFLTPAIEDNIRSLQRQGDRAGAQRVIINAMAGDNQKAEASLGTLTKAWNFVANAADAAAAAIGRAVASNEGIRMPTARGQQQEAADQAKKMADAASAGADAWDKASAKITMDADQVIKAAIPEVAQLEKVRDALAAIERQRAAASGVGPTGPTQPKPFDDQGATLHLQNQNQALEQSIQQTQRYDVEVKRIAGEWGDVGQAVAMQLETMKNNLPVAQAVGAVAKQQAQYEADINNAKVQGKTLTEQIALAEAKRTEAQAQTNAQAEQTLRTLQNQEEALRAVGGAAKAAAKEEETFIKLVGEGVKSELAAKIASQERTNAYRQANAAAQETLHNLQAQLPIIEAIGGAAKMAAQEQATFNRLVRDNVNAETALKVAAAERRNAQAQADAQSKEKVVQVQNETTAIQRQTAYIREQTAIGSAMRGDQAAKLGQKQREMEDEAKINELRRQGISLEQAQTQVAAERANQNAKLQQDMATRLQQSAQEVEMAGAITHRQEMMITFQRAYNALRAQGATHAEAEAVAQAEFLAEQAKINKEIQIEINSLNKATQLINAEIEGNSAAVMAAQAYADAMDRGASATMAAAKAAAVLANEVAKADLAAWRVYEAMIKAQEAEAAKFGVFGRGYENLAYNFGTNNKQYTSEVDPIGLLAIAKQRATDPYYTSGAHDPGAGFRNIGLEQQGYDIDKIFGAAPTQESLQQALASQAQSATQAAQASAVAPYELSLAQAQASRNVPGQVSALRGELGYFMGLPASTENYQKIASLQDSIDQLTKSTDSLNSTNQDLLSPYYTQDPRTSHIGFRSQGMAMGGYVDVPGGYSSNDNMLASIPVASGERIYVDPMTNRRGTASPGAPMVINISSPITINGSANVDQFGRTVYQNNQQLAKQVRAATQ